MTAPIVGQSSGGSWVPLKVNTDGTLAPAPRGSGAPLWQGGVTITNSTANAVVKAAAGAGLRNQVTDLIISNTHSTSVLVTLKDGTTAIGVPILVPAGATVVLNLVSPIRTSANAALNASLDLAVAGAVHINAVGFAAA